MKNKNFMPEMPPIEMPTHLLDYFWDVGPSMAGGMGAAPLTHQEIEAWQRNSGFALSPWECNTLKRLSIEYLNESQRATKINCPAPWNPEDVGTEQKKQIAMNMAEAFRKMASD